MKNYKETYDSCISCTSCMGECPVAAVTNKFKGPKMMGPTEARFRYGEEGDFDSALQYCTNCKICDVSCPSGVSISTLNMVERGEYHRKHKNTLRNWIIAHGEVFGKLIRLIPKGSYLANFGMSLMSKLSIFGMVGISKERQLPAYASQSFKEQFKKYKQIPYDKKVMFFPGCYINDNDPAVGMAFVKLMQGNHYEVVIDESFNCCGSPLVITGFIDEANKHAHHNTSLLSRAVAKGYPIVACCTSCSLMLKQEYTELFANEEASENAAHVYDACEFLEILEENGEWVAPLGAINETMAYHAPCHIRAQGIGLPAMRLLDKVPDLKVVNADGGCCGISGNYGFKAECYDISMAIGETLFNRLEEIGAPMVLSDCGTCRMQIVHGTNRSVKHPVQVLADSYERTIH